MDTPYCETCTHFKQHYYLDDQYCTALDCGHCTYPRLRHRKASAPACKHYVVRDKPPRLPDRHGVIHFLTVKMLEHILTLELPPEIKKSSEICSDEGFD